MFRGQSTFVAVFTEFVRIDRFTGLISFSNFVSFSDPRETILGFDDFGGAEIEFDGNEDRFDDICLIKEEEEEERCNDGTE
jgi:hypothetical protein